ncbi:hypothetical protein CPLU01_05881 [Colletotrichum plurivorum]|uniref:Azaphilone pigments biosynthesis cluster protein L N-terminal domain-containing protein n=1 Tax=Colletotrichum plurivorum TaxID=2175906 RepID=A0A8H6KK00_9PEZI|nr:hypothetical protein CPLU01_05881 [Colletotrichum plurivorum]
MDPLSITTACVGLAGTITTVSLSMNTFIRDVGDARSDIEDISRELSSLKLVLELIADDVKNSSSPLPKNLEILPGVVSNCSRVVKDIDTCIKAHDGTGIQKRARWVTIGKGDMTKLKSNLESHKATLGLALEMLSITALRDVQHEAVAAKQNTESLIKDSREIADSTTKILEAIAELQARLPQSSRENPSSYLLSRYLDELTSDAATVHDNAETRWEELSNFSPEEGPRSLSASPTVELSVDHTTTAWNPYGDGNLHQIWGPDDTQVPSTSSTILETQERLSSSRSRATVTEWNPYGEGNLDQTWGPDDTQRETPRLPSPETLSSLSTSRSFTTEPRPSVSDSVPDDVEPSRQISGHPVGQDSLGDSGNQRGRSTRSFGGLMERLKVSSASQDVLVPPATAESKVFGVTLEESMHHASVEVAALDNSLLSHGVSRTVRGQVPIVIGQCLKFLRAKVLPVQFAILQRRNTEKRLGELRLAFEIAAKDGTDLSPELLQRRGFTGQDMSTTLVSYLSSLRDSLVHWEVDSEQFSFYLRKITKFRPGRLGGAQCREILSFLGRKTCSLPKTTRFVFMYLLHELQACRSEGRVSRSCLRDVGQAVFSITQESSRLGDDVAAQVMLMLVTNYSAFQEFSRIGYDEGHVDFLKPVLWEEHAAAVREEERRREAEMDEPMRRRRAELRDRRRRREEEEKELKFWASVAGAEQTDRQA